MTLVFAGLLGTVALFVIPIVGWGLGGRLRAVGRAYVILGLATVGRSVVAVGEHDDLTLKRSRYGGDLPVDYISLDGVRRVFTDPDNAFHSFAGWPFAFGDEVRGVLFDQRHADLGERLATRQADGDYHISSVLFGDDGRVIDVEHYVRAFFEVDEANQTSVTLSGVRDLVGGDEDSEMADRINDWMEKAFADQNSRTPFFRMLLPIAGGVGGWVLVFMIFTQVGGGGGGGGGGGSIIRIGGSSSAALLLAGIDLRDKLGSAASWLYDHRYRIGKVTAVNVVGLGGLGILYLTLGAVGLMTHILMFVLGIVALPIALFVVGLVVTTIAERAGRLWLRLGLGCWENPVIYLTDELTQSVREADAIGLDIGDATWYTLCKQRVAVDYERAEETFGGRSVSPGDLEDYRTTQPKKIADGGTGDLPATVELTDRIRNANMYGFLPKQSKEQHDTVYVRTDRATRPWSTARTGETAWKEQQNATQEYGGDTGGLSDRFLLLLTVGLFVVNTILAAVVIF